MNKVVRSLTALALTDAEVLFLMSDKIVNNSTLLK